MRVRDVMSREVRTLSPGDSVSRFIALMERHHIHEAPVVQGGRVLGLVHYKQFLEKTVPDPAVTKVSRLMVRSPRASPDDGIDDAAGLMVRTGFRELPVVEKDRLVGVVTVSDLAGIAARNGRLARAPAEALMTPVETLSPDADVGAARKRMRDLDASRLPVVDDGGRLMGVVTLFDLLRTVKPRERVPWFSGQAEKRTTMDLPVTTVLNRDPAVASPDTPMAEVAALMERHRTSGVIIVQEGVPVGVVTARDILAHYAPAPAAESVYLQITGLSGRESDTVRETVDRMLRDTARKLARVARPQYLLVHVKRHEETGKRSKYSVRCRAWTDRMWATRGEGWDLRDAVSEGLDRLERVLIQRKERERGRVRGRRAPPVSATTARRRSLRNSMESTSGTGLGGPSEVLP